MKDQDQCKGGNDPTRTSCAKMAVSRFCGRSVLRLFLVAAGGMLLLQGAISILLLATGAYAPQVPFVDQIGTLWVRIYWPFMPIAAELVTRGGCQGMMDAFYIAFAIGWLVYGMAFGFCCAAINCWTHRTRASAMMI
jgi:hypothetical protein